MMGIVLELIGDAGILAFGVWSLFTFVNIIRKGEQTFIEPNKIILFGEACLAAFFISVGLERIVNDLLHL